MTPYEQSLDILNSIAQLLADHPGTLKDHQMRLNSIEFLRKRLELLNKLETPPAEK